MVRQLSSTFEQDLSMKQEIHQDHNILGEQYQVVSSLNSRRSTLNEKKKVGLFKTIKQKLFKSKPKDLTTTPLKQPTLKISEKNRSSSMLRNSGFTFADFENDHAL